LTVPRFREMSTVLPQRPQPIDLSPAQGDTSRRRSRSSSLDTHRTTMRGPTSEALKDVGMVERHHPPCLSAEEVEEGLIAGRDQVDDLDGVPTVKRHGFGQAHLR